MNNNRRKEIETQVNIINAALDHLRSIQEEEQESFDNLPYGINESEKGIEIEDNANEMDSWIDEINDLVENFSNL